jgi:hypothetical protein
VAITIKERERDIERERERERGRERERARAKRGVYGNVSYMDMKSYFYMDIYLNKWSRELQQESTGRPRVTV